MREFVITDIHGQYKKLKQVFEKAEFNIWNDRLFCLGDLCDRGPDSKKVIDLLMQVQNLNLCVANHDFWLIEWMMFRHASEWWRSQGGDETIKSFKGVTDFTPYINFYSKARPYFINNNRYFAHASIPDDIENAEVREFMWDRYIAHGIIVDRIPDFHYTEIYLGHTVVGNHPLIKKNFYLMDTGAGFGGRVSMMNINSFELFQSDGNLKNYN